MQAEMTSGHIFFSRLANGIYMQILKTENLLADELKPCGFFALLLYLFY